MVWDRIPKADLIGLRSDDQYCVCFGGGIDHLILSLHAVMTSHKTSLILFMDAKDELLVLLCATVLAVIAFQFLTDLYESPVLLLVWFLLVLLTDLLISFQFLT